MQCCGWCGTEVRQGFYVCTGCGAAKTRPGVLVGFIVAAFFLYLTLQADTLGRMAFSIGGLLLGLLLAKFAPIKWYRRF